MGKMNHNKSWNTQSLKHVELVWKAERKHGEEERKISALKSEKKKQDQMADLRQLKHESAGTAERIDWMYRPVIGGSAPPSSSEEYLLGKKLADDHGTNEIKQLASNPGSLFLAAEKSLVVDPRDTANKLRDDPLVSMRRLEKETKENIEKNPVQMQMILEKLNKEEKFRKKFKKELKKLSLAEKDNWVEKGKSTTEASEKGKQEKSSDEHNSISDRGTSQHYKVRDQDKSASSTSTHSHNYHSNYNKIKDSSHENQKDINNSKDDHSNGHHNDNNRYHSRRPSVKQISEEDRKRKLEEMMRDAEVNEEQKLKRLKTKQEEDNQAKVNRGREFIPSFIDHANKQAYATVTVEERITSRKHYRQKGTHTDEKAFKKFT